jgi:serine protease Do
MDEIIPEDNVVKGMKTKRLPVILLMFLLVSILGGVIGSFVYLDYRTDNGQDKTTFAGNTNVTVQESSAVIDAVKKVNPAVVSINGVTQTQNFFGGTSTATTAGTGYIVSADGLIVTNKHVVSDTSTQYSVFTNDGTEYQATIEATDPTNDIAILKINAKNLPVVELGSSDNLQAGQTAIAIGNALGQYQNSVTVGVISAIGRVIQAGDTTGGSVESLDNVIQTDAAINPGNSGGPLLNIEGQVVGMNTAVDQTGQSIGFAIPISLVQSALDSYTANGRIVRPMLGVRYITISKEYATENNLAVSQGALLYSSTDSPAVVSGSPADNAGLKNGDIITKIGNTTLTTTTTLMSVVETYKVGDKIAVTYIRDGKTSTVNITLVESK